MLQRGAIKDACNAETQRPEISDGLGKMPDNRTEVLSYNDIVSKMFWWRLEQIPFDKHSTLSAISRSSSF